MRLIDVDELGVGRCSRDVVPAVYCAGWNGLLGLIEKAPTVDAVPVVHGRWGTGRLNLETGNYEKQCTRCRNFSKEYGKPYCPNCGAKMDGESTEGDVEHGMGSKE